MEQNSPAQFAAGEGWNQAIREQRVAF